MNNRTENSNRFFMIIVFALVVITAARTPLDTDMWWHLQAGKQTLENQSPLLSDVFSFTRMGETWTNHSWLSQVILYGFWYVGGYFGLTIFVVLLACGSIWLAVLAAKRNSMITAFAAVICMLSASLVWTPRPQMFSQLFLAGLIFFLSRFKSENKKTLWLLIPFFIVWSNLHGGFPLGLLYLGLFLIGKILDWIINDKPWPIGQLVVCLVLSIAAVAVNPNGIKMWFIPFQTIGVEALQNYIPEWASPDFHDPGQLIFLITFIGTLFLMLIQKHRNNFTNVFLVLGFGALAFVTRRNIAPAVLVFLPIISDTASELYKQVVDRIQSDKRFEGIFHNLSNKKVSEKINKIINLSFAGLISFGVFFYLVFVSWPSVVENYEKEKFPVEALDEIVKTESGENLLNEYNWGGYIIYHRPDLKVFVDGRTDLFGDEIINQWVDLIQAKEGWQDELDQKEINTVLLFADRPLIKLLAESDQWACIYPGVNTVLCTR